MPEAASQDPVVSVRDRLLDAAEVVAGRDGVHSMTLDAVARQAGMSKGGLLYHFPSKCALVTAIVDRLAARCDMRQGHWIAEGSKGHGAFARAYLRARTESPPVLHRPLQIALLAAAGTDPQYLDPIRNRILEWQARLEEDGIDSATATIIRLAIDGLGLSELLGLPTPTGELRERVLAKLLELSGVAGDSSPQQLKKE